MYEVECKVATPHEPVRERLAALDERWAFGEYLRSAPGYALTEESVACILAGFGRYPSCSNVVAESLTNQFLQQQLQAMRQKTEVVDRACLDHATYLTMLAEQRAGDRVEGVLGPA